jgi:adenylate cyclase
MLSSMHLFRLVEFGTTAYPPKVARRLRGVNIAALTGGALSFLFALTYALNPAPGMYLPAATNAVDTVLLLLVPLLHRYGPLVGANAVLGISSAGLAALCVALGTGSGVYFYYLAAPALAILFFGTDRVSVAAGWAVLGAALIVALHALVPHSTGLMPSTELFYGNFVPTVVASSSALFGIVLYAFHQMAKAEAEAEREHARSEELLAHIMPASVAERLKKGGIVADRHDDASILFADMAGFTARAEELTPEELVRFLDEVFTRFDELVNKHRLEKIKTTGDSYMVVGGVPQSRDDHAEAIGAFALELKDEAARVVDSKGRGVSVRIGIATGPVVAGVVGSEKFFYDVWGDAVNTASRMESTGQPGRIQVAGTTYERLRHTFEFEERGMIEVRGKGTMRTWFLTGPKQRH